MKWITTKEYQRLAFEGKPPSLVTIRRWCEQGYLPAKKMNRMWLIDSEALNGSTGNRLVDKVLFCESPS